jgi:hypothetical protein
MDFNTFTSTLADTLNRSGFSMVSESAESVAWVNRNGEAPIFCTALPSGTWGEAPAVFVKPSSCKSSRKFLNAVECLSYIAGLTGGVMEAASSPIDEMLLSYGYSITSDGIVYRNSDPTKEYSGAYMGKLSSASRRGTIVVRDKEYPKIHIGGMSLGPISIGNGKLHPRGIDFRKEDGSATPRKDRESILESTLSFSERRVLQKQLFDVRKAIDAETNFKKKRELQKQQMDIIAQLEGGDVQPDDKTDKTGTPENTTLAELLSGKYNSLNPNEFLAVVQGVVESINDVKPVIPACISYIEANKDKVSAVMESALRETFGRLWNA